MCVSCSGCSALLMQVNLTMVMTESRMYYIQAAQLLVLHVLFPTDNYIFSSLGKSTFKEFS